MIAFSNNATNGNPIMASKASIAAELRALGVELSASKLKKTTLAELLAMLNAKRADREIAREQTTRKAKRSSTIDLDADSPDADVPTVGRGTARKAKRASNVVRSGRPRKGSTSLPRTRSAPAAPARSRRH